MAPKELSLLKTELAVDAKTVSGAQGTLWIRRVIRAPGQDLLLVCEDEQGEQYELFPHEVWSRVGRTEESAVTENGPYHARADIPVDQLRRIETIQRAVATVQTGDPDYDVYLGGVVNEANITEEFDPRLTTVNQRIAAMTKPLQKAGIPWSRATYFRYSRAIMKNDWASLIHGNRSDKALGSVRELHPELSQVIDAFARAHVKKPDTLKATFRSSCENHLKATVDAEVLRAATTTSMRRLMDGAFHEYRLDQPFKTRQSKAVPNKGKHGTYREPEPFRILQADATEIDLLCTDQKGNVLEHVHLVVVIDVASRMILAIDFFVGSFTGSDLRRLLVRMTQGWFRPHATTSSIPRLPDMMWVPPDTTIKLGSAGVDRGAQFIARETLDLMRRVGMEGDVAPQARGEVKAIVEKFFGNLANQSTALPGYKGKSKSARDMSTERSAMLTKDEVIGLLWAWVENVYHETPHAGLRIPGTNRLLTPREYMTNYMASMGHIEVDQDARRLLNLMETAERTVTHKGIRHDNGHYDSRGVTLAELADSHSGRRGKGGGQKVRIFYSGYRPDAILVQLHRGGELLVCPREGHTVEEPFEDLLNDSLRNMVLEIPGETERRRAAKASMDELVRTSHEQARKPRRRRSLESAPPPSAVIAPESDWFDIWEEE